jgi:2-dehydropantoate 2-reductase
MRVAVLGAGAIGAFVGAHLARSGTETYLLARGAHLAAMRADGLRVVGEHGTVRVDVAATDNPEEIGPVDVVFLGLKAYSYVGAGPLLRPLLAGDTAVVAAQNGIPWWYFHRHGGPFDGRRIESVDPAGAVSSVIAPRRAIGCVVYPAAELVAPGVVRHIEGNRFTLGEADRTISERCRRLSTAMTVAGFKCPVVRNVREQIWVKLMGNAAFNPLSALTGATMAQLCNFGPTRSLVAALMEEIGSVAAALGCPMRVSVNQRLAGAEAVGDHKTSMLQDLEARKPLELDVLLAGVIELSEWVEVEVPNLRAVYAATTLLDRVRRRAPVVEAEFLAP